MATTVLLSLLVGVVIPGVTAVVSREHASDRVKALTTGLLSGLGGVLLGVTVTPPQNVSQWEQVALMVALTWAGAGVSYAVGWKPLGASAKVGRWTRRIGVGREEPELRHHD